ncbi:hypothetical protein DL93DRAFT_502420 [Clavulina sp. PMI_390]|nr:hypothetical protein DL93DRAFT_502420 [Clavulina sp. PMI_390]
MGAKRWRSRLSEILKPRPSSLLQGHSPVEATPTLSGLPPEILLIIIESLEFDAVPNFAQVNRRLRELSSRRLWSRLVIHDDLWNGSPNSRRRDIVRQCRAVISDMSPYVAYRQFVTHLDVHFGSDISSISRWSAVKRVGWSDVTHALKGVLLILPSLKRLSIRLDSIGEENHQSIMAMLGEGASCFPFQLTDFVLYHTPESSLLPFLASQSSIESFRMVCSLYNSASADFWRSVALPNLANVEIFSYMAGAALRGRHVSRVHLTYFLLSRFLEFAQEAPTLYTAEELATVHELSIECVGLEEDLQEFMAVLHHMCISPHALTSLVIACNAWPATQSFPTEVLSKFPQLKNLEWRLVFGETWNDDMHDDLLTVFAPEAVKACPTLERLVFVSHFGTTRSFIRSGTNARQLWGHTEHTEPAFRDAWDREWVIDRMLVRDPDDYDATVPPPKCSCAR